MTDIKLLSEDPYERLAAAIVFRAADDYRIALRKLRVNRKNAEAANERLELERFFRSGWYRLLTDIDGEYLMRVCADQVNKRGGRRKE